MFATRDFGRLRTPPLLVNEVGPERRPFNPRPVKIRFNFVATGGTIRLATTRDRDQRCRELHGRRYPVDNAPDGVGSLRRKCRRAISRRVTSGHSTSPTTPLFAVTTAADRPISHPLPRCLINCQVRRKRGPDVLKVDFNTSPTALKTIPSQQFRRREAVLCAHSQHVFGVKPNG